jgi:lysophospholipid acyltransferase (LPLAT)-like uncharacterized protein
MAFLRRLCVPAFDSPDAKSRYNPSVSTAAAEDPTPRFTLRQRLQLWFITWTGYIAIWLIGPTLRFHVSGEDESAAREPYGTAIYPFWHNCVFAAAYLYRNRRLAVMTSRSFDGEYIARIISRLGYVLVRGSSSRGGAGALLEMHRLLDHGISVAFTIDGPRGPRYVAKPGPVLLARNTGIRIVPFYIAPHRPWVLPSWDGFMLPRPFSRALVRVGAAIVVPPDADDHALTLCHAEIQTALERVRDWAIANVSSER